MRSSKSRSRNKSRGQRSLGNVVNRVFDSSGPEGKVRGTPQQIIEKYLALARDAQLSGDRVAEQSFLQHAEHYTRMLGEAQREQAERQAQHQPNSDDQRDDQRDWNHQGEQRSQNDRHQYDRHQSDRQQDDRQDGQQNNHRNRDHNSGRDQSGRDQNGRDNRRNDRPQQDRAQQDRRRNDRADEQNSDAPVDSFAADDAPDFLRRPVIDEQQAEAVDHTSPALPEAIASDTPAEAVATPETESAAPARTPKPRTPRQPRRRKADADEGADTAPMPLTEE